MRHKGIKILSILMFVMIALFTVNVGMRVEAFDPNKINCEHDFLPATCTEASKCMHCGTKKTGSKALGHDMVYNGSCKSSARKCTRCDHTDNNGTQYNNHHWDITSTGHNSGHKCTRKGCNAKATITWKQYDEATHKCNVGNANEGSCEIKQNHDFDGNKCTICNYEKKDTSTSHTHTFDTTGTCTHEGCNTKIKTSGTISGFPTRDSYAPNDPNIKGWSGGTSTETITNGVAAETTSVSFTWEKYKAHNTEWHRNIDKMLNGSWYNHYDELQLR